MTTYRILTEQELKELQPEFIQYLASNGIDAEKWKSILESDATERDIHLELFSDIVLQKSLEKITFIEHRTPTDIKLFHFEEEEASLIALKSDTIDLEKIKTLNSDQLKEIDLFKASKKYTVSRELELFELLNKGCIISEGVLYYQLKKLIKE